MRSKPRSVHRPFLFELPGFSNTARSTASNSGCARSRLNWAYLVKLRKLWRGDVDWKIPVLEKAVHRRRLIGLWPSDQKWCATGQVNCSQSHKSTMVYRHTISCKKSTYATTYAVCFPTTSSPPAYADLRISGFYLRAPFLWPPPFLPHHRGFIAWLM